MDEFEKFVKNLPVLTQSFNNLLLMNRGKTPYILRSYRLTLILNVWNELFDSKQYGFIFLETD